MSQRITPSEVKAATFVVDKSKVARKLAKATLTGKGRPPTWSDPDRVLWIGLILAAARGNTDTRSVHRILAGLPLADKLAIGFAKTVGDADTGELDVKQMGVSALENVWKRYDRALMYGAATDIDDTERAQRYDLVMDALDGTMRIFRDIFDTGSWAIDASGLWAWIRGRSGFNNTLDLDAGWSGKTGKDGNQVMFYGYFFHAAAAIAAKPGDSFVPPPIIGAVDVTSARHYDLAGVTLGMIDRIRGVREVVVDRLYSNTVVEKWFDELQERGIKQVIQLRAGDHGFTDYDGMKIGVGVVHCPALPEHLLEVTPPREPREPKRSDEKGGTKKEQERRYKEKMTEYDAQLKQYNSDYAVYLKQVEEREAYAMSYVNRPEGPEGKSRVRCPARDGKLACPRYLPGFAAATIAGKPTVLNPPDKNAPRDPACCSQGTVTVKLGAKRKHVQEHYHDSPWWKRSFNRRSTIEGAFGNIKNPNTENLRRGHHRATHIMRALILITATIVAYNLRMTRNWYDNNLARRAKRAALAIKQLEDTELLLNPEDADLESVFMTRAKALLFLGAS